MMNLIMGAAKGYGWDTLEPFVTSCKRNCPDAELVLFVDDMSDFTRDKLIQAGVTLEHFPDELRGIPNNTRWKIFGDWLELHGDDFAQVFITDTRDVIFQGDVFKPSAELKNWLGLATEADDIRGSRTGNRINYNWIYVCFGAAEADKLVDKKIICSGTVIGSSDAMKIFCRELWKILQHKTTNIFDQAAANYLVWNGLLPIENIFELDVEGGEIFTAALFMLDSTYTIKIRGDFILRGDGQIPAVVHQYDRYNYLIELVDKNYRDSNFQADVNFKDVRSVVEQAVCLLAIDKVEAAARLIIDKLSVVKDFSNDIDALIKLWQNALRKPLTKASGDIELAAQAALKKINPFPSNFLEKICHCLKGARDGYHPVDAEFENFVTRLLLHAAQQTLAAGEIERHRFCAELLKILGVESEVTR